MGKLSRLRAALHDCNGGLMALDLKGQRGAAAARVIAGLGAGDGIDQDEMLTALAPDAGPIDDLAERAEVLARPVIVPGGKAGKATAILSARGIALYDVEFQPFAFSTKLLAQQVAALAGDPEIGTLIIEIDSPGGVVTGVPEAGDAIFAARNNADVVALVDATAGSAAYWLASQAGQIVSVPSGDVGSIGVWMLHVDFSAALDAQGVKPTFIFAGQNKIEGNPFEPLSDDTREFFQGEIDKFNADFVRAVARGRGVSRARVNADFGQGRMFRADDALRRGMVDRIATRGAALGRVGVNETTLEGRRRGEDDTPEPSAAQTETDKGRFNRECASAKCGDVIYDDSGNAFFVTKRDAGAGLFRAYQRVELDDGTLTYCKVGGPPENWLGAKIIDEDTGKELDWVVECNAEEGWLVRHALNDDGEIYSYHHEVVTERLEGRFRIEGGEWTAPPAAAPARPPDEAAAPPPSAADPDRWPDDATVSVPSAISEVPSENVSSGKRRVIIGKIVNAPEDMPGDMSDIPPGPDHIDRARARLALLRH